MAEYTTGDVIQFPYLWAWQAARGETEGRKDRPCCLALIVPLQNGNHRIFLLPITTSPPPPEAHAVEVPAIEARRAGLDSHLRQWVMVSEWNADILEQSFYLDHAEPRGRFSKPFLNGLLTELRQLLQAGHLRTVSRSTP